ncbi:MAG: hypothetical protein RMJ67_06370 [Elusimicrobiota bacterium]|nr:hypothetical protein [Endomicrobiia bacterium]MDW8166118.1 hypothetical protein [Elusimicrobiota bacterium]
MNWLEFYEYIDKNNITSEDIIESIEFLSNFDSISELKDYLIYELDDFEYNGLSDLEFIKSLRKHKKNIEKDIKKFVKTPLGKAVIGGALVATAVATGGAPVVKTAIPVVKKTAIPVIKKGIPIIKKALIGITKKGIIGAKKLGKIATTGLKKTFKLGKQTVKDLILEKAKTTMFAKKAVKQLTKEDKKEVKKPNLLPFLIPFLFLL